MKPLPWSYSALSDYVNCPKAFFEKRVAKSVKEDQSEQLLWGNKVHKAFEDYIKIGKPLLPELRHHKDYLEHLKSFGDDRFAEKKIALNTKAEPCTFFDRQVWMRGVIDYHSLLGATAYIVDYKTGKEHSKFEQLKLFALWVFKEYPEVHTVKSRYYWTPSRTETKCTLTRDQIPELWGEFLPDLRQYAKSFHDDLWPARPSGLCNGWCPVKDCVHWKPKRK